MIHVPNALQKDNKSITAAAGYVLFTNFAVICYEQQKSFNYRRRRRYR